MSDEKPPIAESMVRDGLSVGAGVIASHNPLAGALAGLAIGPLAGAAGRVQQFFGDKFSRRIVQTTINLGERTEAEGIETDQERLEELLENGLPFVGRATVEEKRRLMEEVLMNGVRSLKQEGKKAEAVEALKLIEEIPEASILIFLAFIKRMEKVDSVYVEAKDFSVENLVGEIQISKYACKRALDFILYATISNGASLSSGHLIVWAEKTGNTPGLKYYELSDAGMWLAKWITNNPIS